MNKLSSLTEIKSSSTHFSFLRIIIYLFFIIFFYNHFNTEVLKYLNPNIYWWPVGIFHFLKIDEILNINLDLVINTFVVSCIFCLIGLFYRFFKWIAFFSFVILIDLFASAGKLNIEYYTSAFVLFSLCLSRYPGVISIDQYISEKFSIKFIASHELQNDYYLPIQIVKLFFGVIYFILLLIQLFYIYKTNQLHYEFFAKTIISPKLTDFGKWVIDSVFLSTFLSMALLFLRASYIFAFFSKRYIWVPFLMAFMHFVEVKSFGNSQYVILYALPLLFWIDKASIQIIVRNIHNGAIYLIKIFTPFGTIPVQKIETLVMLLCRSLAPLLSFLSKILINLIIVLNYFLSHKVIISLKKICLSFKKVSFKIPFNIYNFTPLKKIIFTFLLILIPIFTIELFSMTFAMLKYQEILSPRQHLGAFLPEYVLKQAADKESSTECIFSDNKMPHPFFGYIYHDVGNCGVSAGFVNNKLEGLPSKKTFDILLVGGSVAEGFGSYIDQKFYGNFDTKTLLIERMFNNKLTGPNGETIRFHNMALGGYAHPSQITTFLHSLGLVDAVISIEGYNESWFIQSRERLSVPPVYFEKIDMFMRKSVIDFRHFLRSLFIEVLDSGLDKSYTVSVLLELIVDIVINKQTISMESRQSPYYKSFIKFNSYPGEMSNDEVFQAKVSHYQRLLKSFAAIAKENNIEHAIFFQPYIYRKKNLSPFEKLIIKKNELTYYNNRREIFLTKSIDGILRRLSGKVNVFDARNIFLDVEMPIFSDEVHYLLDNGSPKNGYHLFVDFMIDSVAKRWNLKPKK